MLKGMHPGPNAAPTAPRARGHPSRLHRWSIFAAVLAAALLVVNVVGLFTSLRNPAIYHEQQVAHPILLTEEEFWKRIASYDGNSQAYAVTVTNAVHQGIAHYWEENGIDKYNLRVPFHENYLLHMASYVFPSRYRLYEFTYFKRAIERGVGLCSQMAIVEARLLKNVGLQSRMVSLTRHVVTEGQVDGDRWWVLDPNYGAVIPHSIEEIQRNPELVREPYRKAGLDEPIVDMLVDIYATEKITVFEGNGAKDYHRKKWYVERAAYVLIWAVPIGFLLLFAVMALRRPRAVAPA
jgi:hypothetical protein